MASRSLPPELEPEPIVWRYPSRSQKKRDAQAIGDLGLQLVKLPPAHIKKLPLEDELRDAILYCRELKKGARARHLRYIRKQLSEIELEPVHEMLRELGHMK